MIQQQRIQFHTKLYLSYILKTGECLHGICVLECPLNAFCRSNIKYPINIKDSHKQEARRQYLILYGEETLFDELL